MIREIKKRVPCLPHWRWLLYKAFQGDHEVDERILQFKRWLKENFDRDEIIDRLDFEELNGYYKTGDKNIDHAREIHKCLPIRFSIEKLLIEDCSLESIQDVVYNKFDERVDVRTLEMYEKIFFDREALNKYDIASFYDEKGFDVNGIIPPVPSKWRGKYQIFQAGGDIDIPVEEIIEHIMYSSLFRAEELQGMGIEAEKLSIRHKKKILDAIDMKKEINQGDVSGLPEKFDIEVTYPEETAGEIEDVDNYDPVEDAGDMEESIEEYEHSFDIGEDEEHNE